MTTELEAVIEEVRAAEIADRDAHVLWKQAIEDVNRFKEIEVEACNRTNHTKQRLDETYTKLKMKLRMS